MKYLHFKIVILQFTLYYFNYLSFNLFIILNEILIYLNEF